MLSDLVEEYKKTKHKTKTVYKKSKKNKKESKRGKKKSKVIKGGGKSKIIVGGKCNVMEGGATGLVNNPGEQSVKAKKLVKNYKLKSLNISNTNIDLEGSESSVPKVLLRKDYREKAITAALNNTNYHIILKAITNYKNSNKGKLLFNINGFNDNNITGYRTHDYTNFNSNTSQFDSILTQENINDETLRVSIFALLMNSCGFMSTSAKTWFLNIMVSLWNERSAAPPAARQPTAAELLAGTNKRKIVYQIPVHLHRANTNEKKSLRVHNSLNIFDVIINALSYKNSYWVGIKFDICMLLLKINLFRSIKANDDGTKIVVNTDNPPTTARVVIGVTYTEAPVQNITYKYRTDNAIYQLNTQNIPVIYDIPETYTRTLGGEVSVKDKQLKNIRNLLIKKHDEEQKAMELRLNTINGSARLVKDKIKIFVLYYKIMVRLFIYRSIFKYFEQNESKYPPQAITANAAGGQAEATNQINLMNSSKTLKEMHKFFCKKLVYAKCQFLGIPDPLGNNIKIDFSDANPTWWSDGEYFLHNEVVRIENEYNIPDKLPLDLKSISDDYDTVIDELIPKNNAGGVNGRISIAHYNEMASLNGRTANENLITNLSFGNSNGAGQTGNAPLNNPFGLLFTMTGINMGPGGTGISYDSTILNTLLTSVQTLIHNHNPLKPQLSKTLIDRLKKIKHKQENTNIANGFANIDIDNNLNKEALFHITPNNDNWNEFKNVLDTTTPLVAGINMYWLTFGFLPLTPDT